MTTSNAGLTPQSLAWRALLVLSLVNILNYYDRMLLIVVSQPIRLEFQLTDTQYGMLTGLGFAVVNAGASLMFGWLADRYSRRVVLAGALTGWSLTTSLSGLSNSFAMLAITRAGMALGEAGSNPAGMSLLSDEYPPKKRAMVLAIFSGAGMLGLLLSFILGSFIASHYGWRITFLVAGIPGIILSVVLLLWIKEPPRGRFDPPGRTKPNYREAIRRLAGNKAFIFLALSGAVGGFASLGMLIWLPQFFIRTHGLTLPQIGMIFGPAAAIGLVVGTLAGGWIGNTLARRSLATPILYCAVMNLTLAPMYLAVLWTGSLPLALGLTFVAMSFTASATPIIQAAMQNVCDPDSRATGAAVLNVAVSLLAQGVLPSSVGILSDQVFASRGQDALRWSLSSALVYLLVAVVLCLLAYRFAVRHYAETEAEAHPS